VNKTKCVFGERSVSYLGHVISADGVAMDAQKVRAVLEWPTPRSVRAVRAFLGLVGYHRRFIKDYSTIAAPLMVLLRKDGFRWSPAVEEAFHTLQLALTMAPVLQLSDFNNEFVVECDVSGSGLGVMLHQGTGLITFSRQLALRHSKLAAYERELIGLVHAVHHWRPYLWCRPFLIKTDHFSLKFLLGQRLATIPQHQWATNVVAGALSQRDVEEEATAMALIAPSSLFDDQRCELDEEADLRALKQAVQEGTHDKHWRVVDGLIVVKHRAYAPPASKAVPAILESSHGFGHRKDCISSAPTSSCPVCALRCATSSMPAYLSTQQDGASAFGGTLVVVGGADHRLGRRGDGLRRGVAECEWQICHLDSDREVLKVLSFPAVGSPLHYNFGGASLLRQCGEAARDSELHRERSGPCFHGTVLAGAVPVGQCEAAPLVDVPSTV
jgi:hypothetical protein